MPMMQCPECKGQVSDSAHDCPKCGLRLTESFGDVLLRGWAVKPKSSSTKTNANARLAVALIWGAALVVVCNYFWC